MRVLGISREGVKTERFEELAAFCTKTLGLSAIHEGPDFVVFRLPGGDQFEVFGPKADHPPEQFASYRVVCGFLVDDIDAARQELVVAGVELIGSVQRNNRSGYAWQHFRGPDGLVYELAYEPQHN